MQIHPSDILLRETLENPRSSGQRVVGHIAQCSYCRKRVRALSGTYWKSDVPDYGCLFGQNLSFLGQWQRRLMCERTGASGLLSTLLEQPTGRRKLLVQNHPRFQKWGLLEVILGRSYEQIFHDSKESEEMARLALLVSDHLNSSLYGLERIEDLRAQAWAYIGNSLRLRGNLPEADQAFEKAFSHLRRGTGDIIERATILRLKASLRNAQKRFDDSLQLLQRTIQVFREAGDDHQVGRTLVAMSMVHHLKGEPSSAILLAQEALHRLDAKYEPRAAFCARHNLIADFILAGRFFEAQGALAKARSMYQQFPEPWAQSRFHYAHGDICRGMGLYREARTHFQAAHQAFWATQLLSPQRSWPCPPRSPEHLLELTRPMGQGRATS
jgi:tetratricopeptide (TPR) repeat protein